MWLFLLACGGALGPADCSDAHAAGWTAHDPLPAGMESQGAVGLDGELWILGGYDFEDGARDEAYRAVLDGDWQALAPLPLPTEHQAALATDAGPLLLGGDQDYGDTVRDVAWVLEDPSSTTSGWVGAAALPGPLTLHTAALRGDDLYVLGGTATFDDDMQFTVAVWHTRLTDGLPGSWTATTALPAPRGWAAAAVLDDRLVVTGGLSSWSPSTVEATVWVTDIAADGSLGAWTEAEALPTGRYRHALTALDGELILTAGDSDAGVLDEVLVADADLVWQSAEPLPEQRYAHAATALDGALVVSGGFYEFRDTRDTVWSIPPCEAP